MGADSTNTAGAAPPETSPQPLVSFLVPSRDRREHLARCLASIESQSWPHLQVIVADDGSEDGTAEMVERDFPTAKVVRLERSAGAGMALGRGLEHVAGDFVICLDDDAHLVSNDVCELVVARFAARPDLGAVCFRVEAPDGTVRRKEIPRRDKRLPSHEQDIGYFLSGAVAYRAEALREAGGFATRIRFGSVELDLAFRLFGLGYRTLFTPDVRVVHTAVPGKQHATREADLARNRIGIAARYLPAPYAHVHASLWAGMCLAQGWRKGQGSQTWRGVREGLADWRRVRPSAQPLSLAQVRDLGRLSGRTWY